MQLWSSWWIYKISSWILYKRLKIEALITPHAIYNFQLINYQNKSRRRSQSVRCSRVRRSWKITGGVSNAHNVRVGKKVGEFDGWAKGILLNFSSEKILFVLPCSGSMRWYDVIVVSHVCVVFITDVSSSFTRLEFSHFSVKNATNMMI